MTRARDETIPAAERLIRAIEAGLVGDVITWSALDPQGTSVYREPHLKDLKEVYSLRPKCIALGQTDGHALKPPIGYLIRGGDAPHERLIAESIPPAQGKDERWLQPRAVDDPADHIAHAEVRLHRPQDSISEKSKRLGKAEKALVMAALAERFQLAPDDPGPLAVAPSL